MFRLFCSYLPAEGTKLVAVLLVLIAALIGFAPGSSYAEEPCAEGYYAPYPGGPCIPEALRPYDPITDQSSIGGASFTLAPGTTQTVIVDVEPNIANITGIASIEVQGENVSVVPDGTWRENICGGRLKVRSWCCDLFTYSAEMRYLYNSEDNQVFIGSYNTSSQVHHWSWHFDGEDYNEDDCCNFAAAWADFTGYFSSNHGASNEAIIQVDVYGNGTCRPSGYIR